MEWLGGRTLVVLVTATVVSGALTPHLRRLALANGIVDHPAHRKRHAEPMPYLGGLAIAAGVAVGLALTPTRPSTLVLAVLAGAAVVIAGLLDDIRSLQPGPRLVVQLAAALVVVAIGLRAHFTGNTTVDVVVTIFFVVGITNALNLLDNMDGLAAGVAVVAGIALMVLAGAADRGLVAAIAAGLVGGCLGFLRHNRPSAAIFMGDAGSLLLGFTLATLSLTVQPYGDGGFGFAVPCLLLALPVLDTTTVTVSRIRRGLRVSQGGKDHLSHRLVARGVTPAAAVLVLVGVEAICASLAVAVGRDVMSVTAAAFLAAFTLSGLTLFVAGAPVYAEPAASLSGRLRAGIVVALAGLLAPATAALGGGESNAGNSELAPPSTRPALIDRPEFAPDPAATITTPVVAAEGSPALAGPGPVTEPPPRVTRSRTGAEPGPTQAAKPGTGPWEGPAPPAGATPLHSAGQPAVADPEIDEEDDVDDKVDDRARGPKEDRGQGDRRSGRFEPEG